MAIDRLDRGVLAAWLTEYRKKIAAWKEIIERSNMPRMGGTERLDFYADHAVIRG